MTLEEHFRPLIASEKEILQRLLAAEFPGRDDIAKQMASCRVRILDDQCSLELKVGETSKPVPATKRIPVEAEAIDEDGVRIHILLHVVNGFASELEIYKEDGSAIKRMPRPEELEVIVLPS